MNYLADWLNESVDAVKRKPAPNSQGRLSCNGWLISSMNYLADQLNESIDAVERNRAEQAFELQWLGKAFTEQNTHSQFLPHGRLEKAKTRDIWKARRSS